MITFSDLTKKVHLINDLILSDMICETAETGDASNFFRHLLTTKNWFSRISSANKKRYVLALLEDVRSAWTLSMLLKSLWNCRPKDAVLSANEKIVWSSYDEVPMDHNRTALPLTMLAQVMKADRVWFLSLEPEPQAMVLSELLIVAGGPAMWVVLRRAQILFERYRDRQLLNIQDCSVVTDPLSDKLPYVSKSMTSPEKTGKKDVSARKGSPDQEPEMPKAFIIGDAQKQLDANLAVWNATIKSMKDSLKLEELEMSFKDGTKNKIWKVNRPKPEAIETVDFIQLLPSSVGKRILSFLPYALLGDYARINKYWSFLVDEFRAEVAARVKIKADFDKLNEGMLRHDTSLELVEQIDLANAPPSSMGSTSSSISPRAKTPTSIRPSEKSGGAYSLRHFLNEKLIKPPRRKHIPIRNMRDLSERLEQRGAADENLWIWCENVLKRVKGKRGAKQSEHLEDGVLTLGSVHFPCPLMKQSLEVPLVPPLYKDPVNVRPLKRRRNISDATMLQGPTEPNVKRYGLWSRNFSGLYPALKIQSYQLPV